MIMLQELSETVKISAEGIPEEVEVFLAAICGYVYLTN